MNTFQDQKNYLSKPPPPAGPPPSSTLSLPPVPQPADPNSVVIQHLYYTLPFVAGRQELCLRHCVQKVFISSFYGDFTIYDAQNRVLGKSKDSKLSFM